MRSKFILIILIGIAYFTWSDGSDAQEKPVSPLQMEPIREGFKKKIEEGVTLSVTGLHLYWKEGLQIDGRYENLKVKIGGSLMVDGGSIHTDNELEKAFSGFEGWEGDFRRLRVSVLSTIYDVVDLKLDVDFANIREIKDNWISLKKKIPILGYVKFGHMKEPFSFERLTSGTNITFMEKSLPILAFAPGRNLGILFYNTLLDDRMTWAVGGFWNTGSLSKVGETTDRVSDADGYNLTARMTGLPWYEEGGKKLLHLGLSYSHGFRQRDQGEVRFRARPESHLKDDRLIDTGVLYTNRVDLINPELAMVLGPFSLQGEYFHAFTGASKASNPKFWGFYLQANYFLTGEHRTYDTANVIFTGIKPRQDFHLLKGSWGAWEVAARLSYLDLNDGGDIKGGQETNLTLGLNWYLSPNLRLMVNYIRAHVEDRRTSPPIDNGYANIVQARFQFAF